MIQDMNVLAFFNLPGGTEWILIALFGLLIFGKRLPEVGKSLGRSIVEFKKGLKGVEDDVNKAVESDSNEMLPPPESAKASDTK
ncbi:MAG TPA: twin-arginine translocase TatA/TatE family subunit [Phycisphaerae bacterium]|nr:twin-arginine translocase TatA/TatE family subunit [Phycisphaerae bacterium]